MKEERKQIVQPDYGEVANVVRSIFERMKCWFDSNLLHQRQGSSLMNCKE
jgi:hypothetical protein